MEECLHCEIMGLIQAKLDKGDSVNVKDALDALAQATGQIMSGLPSEQLKEVASHFGSAVAAYLAVHTINGRGVEILHDGAPEKGHVH